MSSALLSRTSLILRRLPSNHFEAILLPFALLLLAEIISLLFELAQSVATAVGN